MQDGCQQQQQQRHAGTTMFASTGATEFDYSVTVPTAQHPSATVFLESHDTGDQWY